MLGKLLKIFKDNKEVTIDSYNPVNLKIGSVVKIKKCELTENQNLVVTCIEKYTREMSVEVNGETRTVLNVFTDFIIADGLRLRVLPVGTGKQFGLIVLGTMKELEYHQNIVNFFADKEETALVDNELGVNHPRMGSHKGYQAVVQSYEDKDLNGVIQQKEISTSEVHYWDYRYIFEDGQEDYVFAEVNEETKLITVLRGPRIDLDQLTIV